MHKIEGAHLQCVNNHYAKFEYNSSFRLHKLGTPLAFLMEKMSKIKTCQKNEKNDETCTK